MLNASIRTKIFSHPDFNCRLWTFTKSTIIGLRALTAGEELHLALKIIFFILHLYYTYKYIFSQHYNTILSSIYNFPIYDCHKCFTIYILKRITIKYYNICILANFNATYPICNTYNFSWVNSDSLKSFHFI